MLLARARWAGNRPTLSLVLADAFAWGTGPLECYFMAQQVRLLPLVGMAQSHAVAEETHEETPGESLPLARLVSRL